MKKFYLLVSLIGVLLAVLIIFLAMHLRPGIKKTQPFQVAPFVFANLGDAYLQVCDAKEYGKGLIHDLRC